MNPTRKNRLNLVLGLLVFATGCASQPAAHQTGGDAGKSAPPALRQLFAEYWEDRLRFDPVLATIVGDARYDNRLANDISEAHRAQVRQSYSRHLHRLRQFDAATLSQRDRVNRDIMAVELEAALERLGFDEHLLPVDQLNSLPVWLPQFGSGSGLHPFRMARDYENFLSRIRDFETWVDTAIGNMRLGIAKGVVQPKAIMLKVQSQLEAMLVTNVTQSVFYRPVAHFPKGMTESDRVRLRTAYSEAIATQVIPTYRRLHAFIRDEYLPRCRDTVGWSELPQGREWYAHRVRYFTTTQMSLDEIFDLGQREVERLRGEMVTLQQQYGFQGGLLAFGLHLEKADTNVVHTKPELIAAYEGLRGKVEPQLPRLFNRMPKAVYEIRPVAEYQEGAVSDHYWPGTPDGSRPGVFFADCSELAAKPRAARESLFLHEAVPGHHFETALNQEQLEQPDFRRFAWIPAYSEGWGLYCEGLGLELGCYKDPAQRMEWLAMDMWRARRLVVDVGLHAKGWTREQARQYLLENPKAVMSADIEVDRYIADPGQALAYKIGERTIVRLRDEATRTLGTRFDIRAFHDKILEAVMPLSQMSEEIERWQQAELTKLEP
jgi:uncharacterized protein (DUF885 family)